eukprot:Selendium_serpulae@DN4889_c0_g1_i3.p1
MAVRKFVLPELPFAKEALAPFISGETLAFHHDKHHRAYVNKLNQLVEESPKTLGGRSLEDLIKKESGAVFNQAAQVWNHTFYWNCLPPAGRQRCVAHLSAPHRLAQAYRHRRGPSRRSSRATSSRSRRSNGPSRRRRPATSGRAGCGSSATERRRSWPSSAATTPRIPSRMDPDRHCSRATCGSTRTTSTRATTAPPTSKTGGMW